MSMEAFDACLSSGLKLGEVTYAACAVAGDRLGFTLTLDCSISSVRVRGLAETFRVSQPAVQEIVLRSVYGALRWSEGQLHEDEGQTRSGIRFIVRTLQRIPEDSDFWERCLSAFRVRLHETWELPVGHPEGQTFIRVPEGLDVVRRRPEMFLGTTPDPNLLLAGLLHHVALGWLDGSTRKFEVDLRPAGEICITDDGVPFSFEPHDGKPWTQFILATLHGGPRLVRGPQDAARRTYDLDPGWGAGLPIVNGLCASFEVESSDGVRAHRQRFLRGRATPSQQTAAWQGKGTKFTLRLDPDLIDTQPDLPHVRALAERLASYCPGHSISVNGHRVVFESLLAAGQRSISGRPAWNDALFEHSVQHGDMVLRCALGLSQRGTGRVRVIVNLGEPRLHHLPIRGDFMGAILGAVADAVRLPGPWTQAREADLVGIIVLEVPVARIRTGDRSSHFGVDHVVHLDPPQSAAIRSSMLAPLSVFLDSIPESRETLAARWREAPPPERGQAG